jgi:hypothetical protein
MQPLLQWKSNEYYITEVSVALASSMQCACAILSLKSNALQHFPTLSHKEHDFREKKAIDYKMCVSSFSKILSETFFIRRRTERDMIENVYLFFT